jgi:5-methylthioribose kinase
MDEQIIKILEKKIDEIKNNDMETKQIIEEFQNFDSISFSSGMIIGRLFNSFYYQHRRILKRKPTDIEFNEFLEFIKKELR